MHSFIIDPDDKFVQSGFTIDELQEICKTKSMQEPPEIDDDLLHYIDTFAKVNCRCYRSIHLAFYNELILFYRTRQKAFARRSILLTLDYVKIIILLLISHMNM